MIFIIIYIYSNLNLCIYTPSYPHFKAFPVSKFNSETSFLYQLFNENLNFIAVKPCKLINEAFFDFHYDLFISLFMHLYLYFSKKNLKSCKMFIYVCIHVCMYVCMYACVYKFHSETLVPLLLFHRTTRSNPRRMFFECRHRG